MTREKLIELETVFTNEWYKEHKDAPTYADAIEWEHKRMVKKANKWMDDYLFEIGFPDDWYEDSPLMLCGEKRFRIAMEE